MQRIHWCRHISWDFKNAFNGSGIAKVGQIVTLPVSSIVQDVKLLALHF